MFGIYAIVHIKSGKLYIGSTTKSFQYRKNKHYSELRSNTHHNVKLQRAWNKYGEASFDFRIIEALSDRTTVRDIEQYYIDVFYGRSCYNINKNAKVPDASKGGRASSAIQANKSLRRIKSTEARQKLYLHGFISPNGLVVKPVINIRDFCRKHDLHSSHMAQVYNGKRYSHKGWIRG